LSVRPPRDRPVIDVFENLQALGRGHGGLEEDRRESLSGDMDVLGEAKFLLPRQERNLGHLLQIQLKGIRQRGGITLRLAISGRRVGRNNPGRLVLRRLDPLQLSRIQGLRRQVQGFGG
jgi:hypothetical protein